MQAFQSWKENCGKSRQNNPSCWCGIQSGRQTVKPQCAKSPQFLASDRSETSYSVHPSSSCAHPALFCQPRCTLSILFNNFDGFSRPGFSTYMVYGVQWLSFKFLQRMFSNDTKLLGSCFQKTTLRQSAYD